MKYTGWTEVDGIFSWNTFHRSRHRVVVVVVFCNCFHRSTHPSPTFARLLQMLLTQTGTSSCMAQQTFAPENLNFQLILIAPCSGKPGDNVYPVPVRVHSRLCSPIVGKGNKRNRWSRRDRSKGPILCSAIFGG